MSSPKTAIVINIKTCQKHVSVGSSLRWWNDLKCFISIYVYVIPWYIRCTFVSYIFHFFVFHSSPTIIRFFVSLPDLLDSLRHIPRWRFMIEATFDRKIFNILLFESSFLASNLVYFRPLHYIGFFFDDWFHR